MKTLSSDFHGVALGYLAAVLYENEKNFANFTLKICHEAIMSSFVVAYMTKNHFLLGKIDEKIEAFKANSLLDYVK